MASRLFKFFMKRASNLFYFKTKTLPQSLKEIIYCRITIVCLPPRLSATLSVGLPIFQIYVSSIYFKRSEIREKKTLFEIYCSVFKFLVSLHIIQAIPYEDTKFVCVSYIFNSFRVCFVCWRNNIRNQTIVLKIILSRYTEGWMNRKNRFETNDNKTIMKKS